MKSLVGREDRVYHKSNISIFMMKLEQNKRAELAAPYRKGKYKDTVTYIEV